MCGTKLETSQEERLALYGLPNPNTILVDFLDWFFRQAWLSFFGILTLTYYFFVIVFAFLLQASARMDGDCVLSGGHPIGTNRAEFLDAFALSWSTFSTVGYGSTSIALTPEVDGPSKCGWTILLASFETLAGVVFAEVAAAVMFAKVTRIAFRARVVFGEPLLVRYGSGLKEEEDDGSGDGEGDGDAGKDSGKKENGDKNKSHKRRRTLFQLVQAAAAPSPFPVLEFIIFNEMHELTGGHLFNVKVHAAVVKQKDPAEEGDENAKAVAAGVARGRMTREKPKRNLNLISRGEDNFSTRSGDNGSSRNLFSERSSDTYDESDSDRSSTAESERVGQVSVRSMLMTKIRDNANLGGISFANRQRNLMNGVDSTPNSDNENKIDDDACVNAEGGVLRQLVTTKLELENPHHPFFKFFSIFRHSICLNSPLLKPRARHAMANNGGNWPRGWNGARHIRDAIEFDQIVVSFTGISNISRAEVFHQKVYDFKDLTVGYKFANCMYQESDGKLKVDSGMINDVLEQNGGGGESLSLDD